MYGLKKWEIALAASVVVALCWGLVFGETRCCAWWGTVYPELTPDAAIARILNEVPVP